MELHYKFSLYKERVLRAVLIIVPMALLAVCLAVAVAG